MNAEVIDVEVVEETHGAIVPVPLSSLATLAAPIEEIKHAQQQYQEVCRALLDENDIQAIGGREFKKRSAWNKLAVAFGVSTELIRTTHERNDRGRIVRTECVVRAIHPNGRTADGIGACDLYERCCDPESCKTPTTWPDGNFRHAHCSEWPCKTAHFSNPQHDIPATAMTRASNRAKADLFGMGEVSAEEMRDTGEPGAPRQAAQTTRSTRPAGSTKTASEAQQKFVNSLLGRTNLELLDLTAVIGREVVTAAYLTGAEAKKAIDYLQAVQKGEVPKPDVQEPTYSGPGAAEATAPVDPNMASQAQLGKIAALFGEKGFIDDKAVRHSYVAAIVGHEFTSTKELTKREASTVIEALMAEPDAGGPVEGVPMPEDDGRNF